MRRARHRRLRAIGWWYGNGVTTCFNNPSGCSGELLMFIEFCPPGTVCGDGILDPPTEACDDGGIERGDGCSDVCQSENSFELTGVALGGSMDVTIAGVAINVLTYSGDPAWIVANAIADAIDAHPDLIPYGLYAETDEGIVFTLGSIDGVTSNDAGILVVGQPPPMAPGPAPWLLVVALLISTALIQTRAKLGTRRGSQSDCYSSRLAPS
jgi:cysteine-rich repeat protein